MEKAKGYTSLSKTIRESMGGYISLYNDQTGGRVICCVKDNWPCERLGSLEQDDLETL